MVRPQVHSSKHYLQVSLTSVTGGAANHTTIIDAVALQDVNTVSEVREGSSIKACYAEMWVKAGEATNLASTIWCLYKAPVGVGSFTAAEMAALGTADNKKNILATGMGLINNESSQAINIMRGWYKIPKSKQRFGLGDELIFSISANNALDLDICGFFLYKEYF